MGIPGVSGKIAAIIWGELDDAKLVSTALTAYTLNVYIFPVTSGVVPV